MNNKILTYSKKAKGVLFKILSGQFSYKNAISSFKKKFLRVIDKFLNNR